MNIFSRHLYNFAIFLLRLNKDMHWKHRKWISQHTFQKYNFQTSLNLVGVKKNKTHFPDAFRLHEHCCDDQTKLSSHSQSTYQTLFVTWTLNWSLQMPTSMRTLEHCTLVHLRHAFLEYIEDPIEKEKWCTVGNRSLWLNQLAEKHRLKLDKWYPKIVFEKFTEMCR